MLRESVEQLWPRLAKLGDDVDDVLHELVRRRRRCRTIARGHDGARLAGEHRVHALLEKQQRYRGWQAHGVLAGLIVAQLLINTCRAAQENACGL